MSTEGKPDEKSVASRTYDATSTALGNHMASSMLDAQEYAPPVHTHNAVPLIDLALSDGLEPGVDASVGDHLMSTAAVGSS